MENKNDVQPAKISTITADKRGGNQQSNKKVEERMIRFGHWNVRTIRSSRMEKNEKIKREEISIISLQETRINIENISGYKCYNADAR